MDKIIELRKQLFDLQIEKWRSEMLFSTKWWIVLFLTILSWFIWYKIVDKKRFKEICLIGFISSTLSLLLDSIGLELVLWVYPNELLGFIRTFNVFDLTVIPILYMLLYQYFDTWKKYLIAISIFGLIGSLIGQRIFSYFDMYKMVNWKYIYSLPIYLFMGILIKFVASKIISKDITTKKLN